jgi:acetyltransferase-like isoleucine patch superfamily enzyme
MLGLLKFFYMDAGFILRRLFWKIIIQMDGGLIGRNFCCYGQVVLMQTTPASLHIGNNFRILRNATVNTIEKGRIEIGNNVHVGEGTIISAHHLIRIGNDVLIGPHNVIVDLSHGKESFDIPMRLQPLQSKPIHIQNNVWISSQCVILPGVTLGEGSIIGAGAVVTKDVAPYSIVAGIPARVIKTRLPSESLDESLLKKLRTNP